MNEVNFFWTGQGFGFLDNIVIKSHIKVGHKPVLWLSGEKPNNRYWMDIEKKITIKNADEINCNVKEFLSAGGTPIIAGDLWKFNFLYTYGGLYCDTDAFALKKFPDDEWILCSGEKDKNNLSMGVMKVPPKQEIFLECLSKFKKKWGNVKVFSQVYRKHFGNTTPTHDSRLFYPYKWNEWEKLFSKGEIPKNSYSVHFYGYMLKLCLNSSIFSIHRLRHIKFEKLSNYDEEWCKKNPNTLLGKLWRWLNETNLDTKD